MVWFINVDEGKHFSMDDSFPRCHPLYVSFAISACIADAIGVIDDTVDGGGDGFKSSMGMLRKAWDFGPVIHAIWRIWVKVMPVAWVWRFHGFMNGSFWIFIFVIDAKEEGIRGWHRTRLDWYCPQDTSTRGSHAGWFLVVWRASSSCSVQ